MSTTLTITNNTQTNRVYLNAQRESIWITRPTEKQLEVLRSKNLDDVQVVRYKSETRTLYYLKCEDYSSLITAPQAATILALQGRISAEEMGKLKKPADMDKLVHLRTVQQVPYWIETFDANNEPVSASRAKWYVVKFKEHCVSKHGSRADAQKAIKNLTELGQPQINGGRLSFSESTFSILATNWQDLNPCKEFLLFLSGTLPRTQFENSCTALVPYASLLPVPKTSKASKPRKARATKAVSAKKKATKSVKTTKTKTVKTA